MAAFGVYETGLAVALVAILAVAVATLQHREKPGAVPLVATLCGVAVWIGSSLGMRLVDSFALDTVFSGVLYVGVVVVIFFYAVFALEFIGRSDLLTWRVYALLGVEPAVFLLLVWTDPAGGALLDHVPGDEIARLVGPAFPLHLAYSYVLIAVVSGLLVRAALRTERLYADQFAAVLVGVFAPWLSNALFFFGPLSVDLTPIAFAVTGASMFYAIRRFGFMDISPVARDVLVDTIDDATFVVDGEGRIIDTNPAFESLFGFDEAPIGESADDALVDYPAVCDEIEREDPGIVAVDTPDGRHHLDVTVSPVRGRRGRHLGSLVLLYDVTEQHRQRQELRRQNERLDRFASLISHDLRNPLEVAVGRTELALETGDVSHLETVQQAHERMQTLIDDVLDVAKQGQEVTNPDAVHLSSVAERAWRHVDTTSATLSVDCDATVLADETRLLRLFENLFRNAVEHGSTSNRTQSGTTAEHAGPAVAVRVGTTEDGFYVADDGPGFPEEVRESAFEIGHSASDGTGFGLAIVRAITSAHGWDVSIADSTDGGARIEFSGVEFVDPD